MSMMPLLAVGALSALGGAAKAPPAVASRNSSDYNPVTSINNVGGSGDLNAIASLVSTINAGNSYNGSLADLGLNTAPMGGGIQLSTGLLGSPTSFSIGPLILIGAIVLGVFYLKKRK